MGIRKLVWCPTCHAGNDPHWTRISCERCGADLPDPEDPANRSYRPPESGIVEAIRLFPRAGFGCFGPLVEPVSGKDEREPQAGFRPRPGPIE